MIQIIRDKLTHYVDSCCMCTKLNCDECDVNEFINDLEELLKIATEKEVSE